MKMLILLVVASLLSATACYAAEPANSEMKQTITTKSGLQYTSLQAGSGRSPGAGDTVRVNYRGTLPNGREFDSSYKNGRPAEFNLGNVIKCWTEGMQMMKVGGKARLVCPSNIAYGDNGIPGSIPPFATLTFEVELIAVR
jgi:FKBP-type peptidyl-prolyl cis-trans isomerase FkpA